MAQLIVKAVDYTHPDPDIDRRAAYKRGHPVAAVDDGRGMGNRVCLPKFVVLQIPNISVATLKKYIEEQKISPEETYRRRRWRVRWDDLPPAAKQALAENGELTIKATSAYTGEYDYTWTQIKSFFHNDETDEDETADLES